MNIGIFIDNTSTHWGPGRLAHNTIKGLQDLNINYKINDYSDFNICISGNEFQNKFLNRKVNNTIIGPCSMNVPSDFINSFNDYGKFLVASEWYKKNWVRYGVDPNKIHTWFGGIDTDKFLPNKNIKYDCLIMLKNRDYNYVNIVKSILSELNLSHIIINNGSYNEDYFINLVNQCSFGIVIHNTETQGFAIMEAMSMNLPLFVLDQTSWEGSFNEATSVPYFSDDCGMKLVSYDTQENIKNNLINFLNNLNTYNPRKFIVENFTIKHSIDLLIKYFTIF